MTSLMHDSDSSYLRLLVIGDSVDRYMVDNWCKAVDGNLHTEISWSTTNHSNSATIHEIFHPYKSRHRSWEIRVCEDWRRKVYVSTIANKFGVKPFPPWHMPIRTMSGLETILTSQNLSLSELFALALAPALIPVNLSTGGEPHGVMLNTAFWDLSHPDPHQVRTRQNKENWLQSWSRNLTEFMHIVKTALPRTTYFGHHTGNDFPTVNYHWNTPFALELLHAMNNRSARVAAESGFDWVDFARYPIKMRDHLHPTAPSLIQLCNDVLLRTRSKLSSSVI